MSDPDPKREKLISVLNDAIEQEAETYRQGGPWAKQHEDELGWQIDGDIQVDRIADFIMEAYGWTRL